MCTECQTNKFKMKNFKIDKSAFSIGSIHDEGDEKEYWLSKSPQERIEAIEIMWQIIYGYNPSTNRLQRFFEITELKRI